MNQEESQAIIILLLAGILVVVGVIAYAVTAPQSFYDVITNLNKPVPNIFDAVQQASQQAANGDTQPVMSIMYPILGIVGVGALFFTIYELSRKQQTSNTEPTRKE